MSTNKGGARRSKEEAEVDELLRAAEDHLLLGLHTNAHTTTSSSLDPDLARRFQSLKSPPPPRIPAAATVPRRPPPPTTAAGGGGLDADDESLRILGDDLAARFAALKGSTSSSSAEGILRSGPISGNRDDRDGEDEVEKVMQWAMDAARLDPSGSDEEFEKDNNDDDDESDDEDEEKDLEDERKKKEVKNQEKGKKPKKWGFF